MAGTSNPWSDKEWNITLQGVFVRNWGMDAAQEYAKKAGTTVGGPRPSARDQFPGRPWPGPRGRQGAPGADGAGINPFLFLALGP